MLDPRPRLAHQRLDLQRVVQRRRVDLRRARDAKARLHLQAKGTAQLDRIRGAEVNVHALHAPFFIEGRALLDARQSDPLSEPRQLRAETVESAVVSCAAEDREANVGDTLVDAQESAVETD